MRVYLNNISQELNILPTQSQTLDETLDGFSFTFLSSYMTPIAPMNVVRVEEGLDTSYFVVVVDSVEPFTQEGNLFRHTISCTQNTKRLTKKQIRNSSFTQPPRKYHEGFRNRSYCEHTSPTQDPNYYTTDIIHHGVGKGELLTLESREKCYKAFINLRLQCGIGEADNRYECECFSPNNIQEIRDKITDQPNKNGFAPPSSLELRYNLNGVPETETIYPSDCGLTEFIFNQDLNCPKILNLLKQGATDLGLYANNYFLCDSSNPVYQYPDLYDHLAFYNVNLIIKAEVYYNSCLDILQHLIDRHVLMREIDNTPIQEEQLFYLPQSGDLYNLLNETPAPNFVFTELSLYECVAEVFRLFDAIFTLSGENILGIEFFNARGANITPKLAGMNSTLGDERYANSLLTYFQDARVEDSFPSKKSFAHLRTKEIGVPSETDHVFLTPKPIQNLIQCEIKGQIKTYQYMDAPGLLEINNFEIDLTHFVVHKSIWTTLDTTSTLPSDKLSLVQRNTIPYDNGGIEVAVKRTLANNTQVYNFDDAVLYAVYVQVGDDVNSTQTPISHSDWNSILMRVDYVSSIDGKTKVETIENKVNGEILVDQSNGGVDLSLMGANMVGLSLRTGNPSLNCVHRITSWANRIKKGQVYVYNNKTWIANSCAYSFTGEFWQGQISFIQNYNEMNLRKRVLSERRFSEISSNLVLKSEEIITERVYVSLEDEISAQDTHIRFAAFRGMLADRFGIAQGIKNISYSYLEGTDNIYIPLVVYGAGNAINFEMSFDSPISAGIQTSKDQTGWQTGYYSTYVKYTDEQGFLDDVSLVIGQDNEDDLTLDYPIVPSTEKAIYIEHFLVGKQPNEIFALNYQLSFLSTDLNIGRKLVEDNLFTNKEPINSKIRLFFGSEPYTPMETLGKGDEVSITSISLTNQSGGLKLSLSFPSSSGYWAITDENKNILISSKTIKTGIAIGLYFKLRRDRI